MKIQYALILTAILTSLTIGVGLGYNAKEQQIQQEQTDIYMTIVKDLGRKYKLFSGKHDAEQSRVITLQSQGQRNIDLDTLHYWSGKSDGIRDALHTIQDQVKQAP